MERHVCDLIEDHLKENDLLSDRQWGFRGGRSTVSALLAATSDWFTLMEAGMDVCAVFFDYRKAFDSVPHHPLLNKLTSNNLNPFLLRWIANYLTLRTQRVVVEGAVSSTEHVLSGVPQGSVLGPLLFLIYIDGVSTATASALSKNSLFADDLLLYRPISNPSDFTSVQEDIATIEAWSNDNYLTLNSEKCKWMVISRKRSPPMPAHSLTLNGQALQQVDSYKYLGVLLSRDLSWSPHIDSVCSKARKILGLLYRRLFTSCSPTSTLQLYRSLVRPHLEYACQVWSPHTAKAIGNLEGVQKFALKMVTRSWSSDYDTLLRSTGNIPTLARRRLDIKLIHLCKIVNNL